MINFAKSLFVIFLLAAFTPIPALAEGEITVEMENGDTDSYSEVEIFNTPDILYFKAQNSETMLLITKNECEKEGELLVCNQARVGVDTNGVVEELETTQIVLFINATDSRQAIKGSKVTLSPNTVLLEMATAKGSYITALGKIDSSTRPEEASK